MNKESERFRKRAQQCRELSASARTTGDRDTLAAMARDLDEEADRVEADDAGPA